MNATHEILPFRLGQDATPHYDRKGNVVIDVSYIVRDRYTEEEVYICSTRDEASEAMRNDERDLNCRREVITQTPEEFYESEFSRIHDC